MRHSEYCNHMWTVLKHSVARGLHVSYVRIDSVFHSSDSPDLIEEDVGVE